MVRGVHDKMLACYPSLHIFSLPREVSVNQGGLFRLPRSDTRNRSRTCALRARPGFPYLRFCFDTVFDGSELLTHQAQTQTADLKVV